MVGFRPNYYWSGVVALQRWLLREVRLVHHTVWHWSLWKLHQLIERSVSVALRTASYCEQGLRQLYCTQNKWFQDNYVNGHTYTTTCCYYYVYANRISLVDEIYDQLCWSDIRTITQWNNGDGWRLDRPERIGQVMINIDTGIIRGILLEYKGWYNELLV